MIRHSMQLGFISFLNLSSVAARHSNYNLLSRIISMGKRPFSSLSKAALSDTNDKQVKGPKKTVVQENVVGINSVEIQSIKDDPTKIEAMTVEQLRTTLRAIGAPIRGRKRDLISALKCFLDKECDDNSLSDEGCTPTMDSALDVSDIKQSKKRAKQTPSKNTNVKVSANITTEQTHLIKTDEFSVGKPSQTTRTKSFDIVSGDAKAVDLFTLPQAEPWTVLAHKKPQKGWIPYNPRTMRPPRPSADTNTVRLMSWNVNGLRALLKLEGFSALELAQRENFDVLCIQETKLQEKDVESIKTLIEGYQNSFWTCSLSKLGYSGTAIISRIKPLSIRYGLGDPEHDNEGRVVTAEFDSFYLLSVYVPNSGDGLKRLSYRITQWDQSLSNYMKELEKSKPVILTGDLNCAHQEIDIFNPAGNRRSAGFTDEERQSFETNFLSRGFVDTFRKQHPNVVGYTYWGYRHGARKTNKGWRLDYFLVSESIADKVHDSYIVPDIPGSDHCPIGLILKL